MFRLREAIVAVHPSSEHGLTIVTVPHDAVLEIISEPQNSGLVEARWKGQDLEVFVRDLEARGERIEFPAPFNASRQ